MRDPRNEGRGKPLDLSQNIFADNACAVAYAGLVEEVFGVSVMRSQMRDPAWQVIAYFDADGSCVAGLEVGELALMLDGVDGTATAIRLAGVALSHRGRGLFRDLVERALSLSDSRNDVPTLLYTEDEALYSRFGFFPLAQHAFVGAPPQAAAMRPARHLALDEADVLLRRLASARAPVSLQCAVRGGADLLRANLDEEGLHLALLDGSDALVVYETDGDELTVVDIVAATIPTLAEILGALGISARRVRTLFPPDRLGWNGVPVPDDTGLMIRGSVPPAMRRPFMLPPTTSF